MNSTIATINIFYPIWIKNIYRFRVFNDLNWLVDTWHARHKDGRTPCARDIIHTVVILYLQYIYVRVQRWGMYPYHTYILYVAREYGMVPGTGSRTVYLPSHPPKIGAQRLSSELEEQGHCDSVYSTDVIRSHSGRKNLFGHHRFGTWTECSILYIDLEGVNKSVVQRRGWQRIRHAWWLSFLKKAKGIVLV
jgi:hypothetical protein